MAFTPPTLTVATGATLTWKNTDDVAHTVKSEAGWFASGQIPPGGESKWQANQTGYVADWQENKVRVYDAGTFAKGAEIDGIVTPTGIFNSHRRTETMGR